MPIKKLKPVSINTNTSKLELKDSEATFLKNYELTLDKDTGNFGVGKRMPSNYQTVALSLPIGANRTIGFFENPELNEAYVFNWNQNNQHGIYHIDGLTMQPQKVYEGSALGFSIDPKYKISEHRVLIRVVYDTDTVGNKKVKEKYLIWTDGLNWQKWINVNGAIATNGLDASLYPYFNLHLPHFDAAELIDYPVRPPMYAPVVTAITPSLADKAKPNLLLDKSIQFAILYIMTDGRPTALSPYSTPYFSQDSNNDVPRTLELELYAGSAHVERMQILTRLCGGDWELYDTIDRFDTKGANDPTIIGDEYWKRTNQWGAYGYKFNTNTIKYTYSGDLGTTIFSVSNGTGMVQNDIPLKSIAVTSAGDSILWGDNLYFYPNIPDETLKNISLGVADTVNTGCISEDVTITLFAIMVENGRYNTLVFKNGVNDTQRYFGSSQPLADHFELNFNGRDGHICYLAGTNYFAIGKQYVLEANGTKSFLGVLDFSLQSQKDLVKNILLRGALIIQQFDFTVPAGNYLARIARHNVDINSDYTKTSTYIMGLVNRGNLDDKYGGFGDYNNIRPGSLNYIGKEMVVNATSGDYTSLGKPAEMFYIYTPFWPHGIPLYVPGNLDPFSQGDGNPGLSWRFVEGYVQEDTQTKYGCEALNYSVPLGDDYTKRSGFITDHNGFFFGYSSLGDAYKTEVAFQGNRNCGYQDPIFNTSINKTSPSDRGWHPNTNVSASDNFGGAIGTANYVLVKGKVVDCAAGIGIAGIGVTFEGGQTYYTDSNGDFILRYHVFYREPRYGYLYINSSGRTVYLNCNCFPIQTSLVDGNQVQCQMATEQIYPQIFNFQLKEVSKTDVGLKGGGKYPIYINGHDLAGRKTYSGFVGYVDIPTFLEKGNFSSSKIRWTLTGNLNLPPDIKWLTFGIGKNTIFIDYLQWVGDKIEFLDKTGAVVPDGNGAVRAKITIQSLLNFNNLYNFATTVSYQFVPGDRIRFYDNGSGILFKPADNNGFLDYRVLGTDFNETVATPVSGAPAVDGKSFIIDYDSRLLALKNKCGFWIELNRPLNTVDKTTTFGIAGTYPVINGEIGAVGMTAVLNAFDTYQQRRNIIIPDCSNSIFNHPFESNSITDFWGKGCDSSGMILFRDQLAEQRWYEDDTMRTDEFLNEGRVNGLGICRTANRKSFKTQNWGGVIAMKAWRNMIYFICQNDWFVTDLDMNYARVDSSGRLIADPNQNLGTPHQKEGDDYGCEYEDTGSIIVDDGRIFYADRKNSAYVMLAGGRAVDLAAIDNENYFINKFKYLINHNVGLSPNDVTNNLMEVVAGINPYNGAVYITFNKRKIILGTAADYVNNEREIHYDLSETFVYSPMLKKWTSFTGFTPEFYGKMKHAATGEELITFVQGRSWFHNSKAIHGYNKFYDIRTDHVITIAVNGDDASKLKIYQRAAIESQDMRYFIFRIATDDPGLFSYVPLNYWTRRGNVWYSKLLRNMNTYPNPNKPVTSMLVDGKGITGNYAEFTFVGDTNRQEDYSQVNNILIGLVGSEKSEK